MQGECKGPQVRVQLEDLSGHVERLEETVQKLVVRLEQVAVCADEPQMSEGLTTPAQMVPMANELRVMNSRLASAGDRLVQLLNAIEV